jgi:hypothetical protein
MTGTCHICGRSTDQFYGNPDDPRWAHGECMIRAGESILELEEIGTDDEPLSFTPPRRPLNAKIPKPNRALVFLGLVPDVVVCWIAASITESGSHGFFIALLVLYGLQFALWLKRALWAWLLFWIYLKTAFAREIEQSFSDNGFPQPDHYTYDVDDYLHEIVDNGRLPCATRVIAAKEIGHLEGLKMGGRYSAVFHFLIAGKLAVKNYRSILPR